MVNAWIYPLKGIYYFASHPFLYPLLRARLLPCIFLSAFVISTLFIWTYIPQVIFLRLFHGPGAWLNGTFLVLGEGAAITALLFEAFLADESMVDVFDAVLVNEGCSALVAESRPVDPDETLDPVRRLGRPTRSAVYSPFSLRQIVEFILLLPLSLVPWIGVPLFLWLTGYRAGPLHHHRYFKLRGLSKQDKAAFVKKHRLSYTGFGSMALVLQIIPVLSMIFLLTSAAGSALWAANVERQRMLGDEPAEVEPEDPPPEYTDAPV